MIPAAQVHATETIKTAPVKANCATVPQIPSGRANSKASTTAMAPTCAVETRQALKSAQQGPIRSRPMRMSRGPRSASAAVMSNMIAMLNLQAYFEAQPQNLELPMLPSGGRSLCAPKVSPSRSSLDDDMQTSGSGHAGHGLAEKGTHETHHASFGVNQGHSPGSEATQDVLGQKSEDQSPPKSGEHDQHGGVNEVASSASVLGVAQTRRDAMASLGRRHRRRLLTKGDIGEHSYERAQHTDPAGASQAGETP